VAASSERVLFGSPRCRYLNPLGMMGTPARTQEPAKALASIVASVDAGDRAEIKIIEHGDSTVILTGNTGNQQCLSSEVGDDVPIPIGLDRITEALQSTPVKRISS